MAKLMRFLVVLNGGLVFYYAALAFEFLLKRWGPLSDINNSHETINATADPNVIFKTSSPTATATATTNFTTVDSTTKAANETKRKPTIMEDLPPEFRVCRLTGPHRPIQGERRREGWMPGGKVDFLHYFLLYQCAGDAYDQFMLEHQFPYVRRQHNMNNISSHHPDKWGTRSTIVPYNNNKNRTRTILIMGNSHTRQMVGSLLCQYHTQIRSTHTLTPPPTLNQTAFRYELYYGDENYLNVIVLTNHPSLYSPRWDKNLEDFYLGSLNSLEDLDAIVIGNFNPERYVKVVQAYSQHHPNEQIEVSEFEPPVLKDVAQKYKGPIITCSMLGHTGNPNWQLEMVAQKNQIVNNTGRTNLRNIDTRDHFKAMGNVECRTNNGRFVDSCFDVTNHFYHSGHGCMGDKGGQPDMVAWDVIEALHDVML